MLTHRHMKNKAAQSKKIINSWIMYDWANSAYITIVIAAVYPPFYRSIVKEAGFSEGASTAMWAYTASLALGLIFLAGPLLGAISDHLGGKKRFLAISACIGILATTALAFTDNLSYLAVSAIFIISNIGYSASILFYESLLPHIAKREDIDIISARGYTLGYLGGGILLLLNLLWLTYPQYFGLETTTAAVKACLVSVSIWWALFTIPLLKNVPEPEIKLKTDHTSVTENVRNGCRRLVCTVKEASRYRQLLLFLPAFWLYYEAIGTIIKMATAYGDEIGIGLNDMVLALLITQFIGIPSTLLFGRLAKASSAKTAILCGLGIYAVTIGGAFFMSTSLHFYMLAVLIGIAQGGTQALSRSLFASMVPKTRSAEFFGLFSSSEKAAGLLGPLVFGITSQISGESRYGIVILEIFLLAGMVLLYKVDVEKGIDEAERKDSESEAALD
jgi:MFS transporter, UMF1 family